MNIRLDLIQPSPQPVRTSWDEGKMAELIESIRERGVIAPIKVRPVDGLPSPCILHGYSAIIEEDWERYAHNDDRYRVGECDCYDRLHDFVYGPEDEGGENWGDEPIRTAFEIVYGHRRFEASRRLGVAEIPAIVGEPDENDELLEQIIENEVREDVPFEDKAQAYRRAMQGKKRHGEELSRLTGIPAQRINEALRWLIAKDDGVAVRIDGNVDSRYAGQGDGVMSTLRIAEVLGDDLEARRKVAEKISREGGGQHQARKVAQAYKAAEDEHERQAVLDTDIRDPEFERLTKAKANVHRDFARDQQRKRQEDDREVKTYIDALRTFRLAVQEATRVAQYGKFAPEAARFVIRQHDLLSTDLSALENAFGGTND